MVADPAHVCLPRVAGLPPLCRGVLTFLSIRSSDGKDYLHTSSSEHIFEQRRRNPPGADQIDHRRHCPYPREPKGRGAVWTEERGTSDEGRRCSEEGMGRWVGTRRRARQHCVRRAGERPGPRRWPARQVRVARPAVHRPRHPRALGHQPGVVAGSRGRARPARAGVLAGRGVTGPGHDRERLRAAPRRRHRRLDPPPRRLTPHPPGARYTATPNSARSPTRRTAAPGPTSRRRSGRSGTAPLPRPPPEPPPRTAAAGSAPTR
jgi:hypothetical protein